MAQIIHRKTDSTVSATFICAIPAKGRYECGFYFENASLYRSAKAEFFLAAHPRDDKKLYPVMVLTKKDAMRLCETYGSPDQFIAGFALPEDV